MLLDLHTFIKLPEISTNSQFLKKLKYNVILKEKMFFSESTLMEINILIKSVRVSFLKIKEIYRRVLIIPISSATTKKNFLTMKRIKIYTRSNMTGKRLHKLALLSIEKEKSKELMKNTDKILNKLACDELNLNFSI